MEKLVEKPLETWWETGGETGGKILVGEMGENWWRYYRGKLSGWVGDCLGELIEKIGAETGGILYREVNIPVRVRKQVEKLVLREGRRAILVKYISLLYIGFRVDSNGSDLSNKQPEKKNPML